jgi:ribonuclease VapC
VVQNGREATHATDIKDPETERLAAEVARLMGESETRAIRVALQERKQIVLSVRMRPDARPLLARFLHEFRIMVVAFGEDHWTGALDAFQRFGKGKHPAGVSLGDCFSYAVASLADQPLLCVGGDFRKTDLTVAPVLPRGPEAPEP